MATNTSPLNLNPAFLAKLRRLPALGPEAIQRLRVVLRKLDELPYRCEVLNVRGQPCYQPTPGVEWIAAELDAAREAVGVWLALAYCVPEREHGMRAVHVWSALCTLEKQFEHRAVRRSTVEHLRRLADAVQGG